ncbi:MAG TPA: TrkA family potassium uptake protein [Ktedonobacterales bacterium]|nr:TrkA family potassium uptake protein [Ktedonobacterales bacterium]
MIPPTGIQVIIIGCGHLGAQLAERLDRAGYLVNVIAPTAEDFERLSPAFSGRTTLGDGTQTATLEHAGIAQAAVLIALTNDDNKNLLVCQLAQDLYQTPHVLCGLQDPALEEVFRPLGITIISRIEIEVPRFLKGLPSTP